MEKKLFRSVQERPYTGKYLQVETGEKFIISEDDAFSSHQKETSEVINNFHVTEEHSAHYKLIKKNLK